MKQVIIVKLSNQGVIEIIPCFLSSSISLSTSSLTSTATSTSFQIFSTSSKADNFPSSNLLNDNDELLILKYWKDWIDFLGKGSAQAQFLKEPITCSNKFINELSNSPFQYKDNIYLLIKINSQKENNRSKVDDRLEPIGLLRVGRRNLFFEDDCQLVNINQCFSVLDFYVKQQRQGLGYLLFSKVIQNETINANQIAFDRPTNAMLSFLKKHFNLKNPIKQHNHFVIFDGFFQNR